MSDSDLPIVELNGGFDVREAFNSDIESSRPSGVLNALAMV